MKCLNDYPIVIVALGNEIRVKRRDKIGNEKKPLRLFCRKFFF